MKLLRDVFRLRGSRSLPFAARREAPRREFVVTVPAPLPGAAAPVRPSGPVRPLHAVP